jgi:translin
MKTLTEISEKIHQSMEKRLLERDKALTQARQLTRHAAHTIRAIHRNEHENADHELSQAKVLVEELKNSLVEFPELYYAGYTQDAIKEFAEATLTRALVLDLPLPTPQELGVEDATYLNGLAEANGELRRRCLDILRQGYSQEAERLLSCMDDIYGVLITMDYPDSITNGLRRQTDIVRSLLERTRGDLTLSLREEQLKQALTDSLEKLSAIQNKHA